MDLGLEGRRAIVVGGGRGLGRGVAEALAGEGVRVAIVSRDGEALARAATEIGARTGNSVLTAEVDIANAGSIERGIGRAVNGLGGVDILINNSGGPPPTGAAGVAAALWREQFEMLVLGVVQITDMVLPAMRAGGWGRVITIASTGVVEPNPLIGLSNALRSTLVGWSKTLAGEVGRDGVTVNMLLPGRIATERMVQIDVEAARRRSVALDRVRDETASRIPVGRYGTAEEFGKVAAFLASTAAGYISGSMIRVDGGAVASI